MHRQRNLPRQPMPKGSGYYLVAWLLQQFFAFMRVLDGIAIGMLKYKIARQGKIIGEYDADLIQDHINSGEILVADHGWAAGMDEWKQLNELGYVLPASEPPPLPLKAAVPISTSSLSVARPSLPSKITADQWRSMPVGPIPATCSKCASTEIKSFGIIHQKGSFASSSIGFTLSGQIGGMVTSGQTGLADATEPPRRQASSALSYVMIGLLIGGGLLAYLLESFRQTGLFIGAILFVACVSVSIYLAIQKSRRIDLEYAKDFYFWKCSWCCMKCGHRFRVIDPRAS